MKEQAFSLLLKTFFDKMPKELEDAARIDGCSKIGIWRHVALPLCKPVLAVVVVLFGGPAVKIL